MACAAQRGRPASIEAQPDGVARERRERLRFVREQRIHEPASSRVQLREVALDDLHVRVGHRRGNRDVVIECLRCQRERGSPRSHVHR